MEKKLKNRKVAILVTNGFEQRELTEPRKELEKHGATTHIVSFKSGAVKGWDNNNWGDSFEVDKTLDEVTPDDYDALFLPGGVMNPDQLRKNRKVVEFVKAFMDEGKPVAAICHGPWTLIETGALEGRTLTSYESIKTDLINAGANWVNEEVVVDSGLVTSRHPGDIPAFNKKMVEEFYEGIHVGNKTI